MFIYFDLNFMTWEGALQLKLTKNSMVLSGVCFVKSYITFLKIDTCLCIAEEIHRNDNTFPTEVY